MKASDYLYTYSGKVIDPSKPHIDDIDLYDIAYGLAGIMRYNAQTRISVLRHSIALANCCESDSERLWALLHDAPEAYMLDVPVPHKKYMSKHWQKSYDLFERLILARFQCNPTDAEYESVLKVDKQLVEYEMGSRIRFEPGSKMECPFTPTMDVVTIRNLDVQYAWELSDNLLMKLYISWIKELINRV